MTKPVLRVNHLSFSYGASPVLRDCSFEVKSGEILGLVGENGAGKSTLNRCVLGLLPVKPGMIELTGRAAAIHQEFDLVPDLTATQNIFLGRELHTVWGGLKKKAMKQIASELFSRLELELPLDVPVGELPISVRQMVAVAKALYGDPGLLILDEPGTLLNKEETRRLFRVMRQCADRGAGLIFITHKLAEIAEICDRVAVLRDGELQAVLPATETTPEELAARMVGRELKWLFPEKREVADAEIVLEVENLTAGDRVKDASFSIRAGEILGLAGLAGAGRSELAEAICGLRRSQKGTIKVNGRPVKRNRPSAAMESGISLLSEDRRRTGILLDFSIRDNATLASLKKYIRYGLLSHGKMRKTAWEYIEKFQIKCLSDNTLLRELSGGNQQKVAIAKGLDTNPKVFLFDEPTRGVDVAARREIYDFIYQLAAEGAACLLISSDLEEVLGLCRKIMVMREGRIVGSVSNENLTEEAIIYLATGVK